MIHAGDEDFHDAVVSKEEGSSPSTYHIVMVSLSGSLLLLVAISVAISILRRHCTSNFSSKDLSTPVVMENTSVMSDSSDKISTVDLNGPMCISYISDTPTITPESELPFFSFAVSVTPPSSVLEK